MLAPLTDALPTDVARALAADPIVVCEVGARGGGKGFRRIGKFVHYVGFEPDREQARLLEKALRGTASFQKITIEPSAIMGEKGPVKINVLRHPGCSSALSPDAAVVARYAARRNDPRRWSTLFDVVGSYQCDAITLDEFRSTGRVPRFDYLGLDTQGTEKDILLGAQNALSGGTLMIHVEMEVVPIYRDQSLLRDIIDLLDELGFQLARLENPQYARRDPAGPDTIVDSGELISVDGLFYRDPAEPDDVLAATRHALLLHEAGMRTLAIAVARRCGAPAGAPLAGLAAAMESALARDSWRLLPARSKARVLAGNVLPQPIARALARLRRRK